MSEITVSSSGIPGVGDRVLFTKGASENRPGVVREILDTPLRRQYKIAFKYWLPAQRQLDGTKAQPSAIFCDVKHLLLVTDVSLTLSEFLALTPVQIRERYL